MASSDQKQIDPYYRPSHYFGSTDLETHLISTIKATDRRNLQRVVLVSGSIEATHETSLGRHRPACLYSAGAS